MVEKYFILSCLQMIDELRVNNYIFPTFLNLIDSGINQFIIIFFIIREFEFCLKSIIFLRNLSIIRVGGKFSFCR